MRRAPPPARSSSSSSFSYSSAAALVISPTLLLGGLSSCSPDPRTHTLIYSAIYLLLRHISSRSSQCECHSSLCVRTLSCKQTDYWTYFSFSVDLLPAKTPTCPSLPCHSIISLPVSALCISIFSIFPCRFSFSLDLSWGCYLCFRPLSLVWKLKCV